MDVDFKKRVFSANQDIKNQNRVMDSGSESAFIGSWGSSSSSSFLNTSFESELDSNETDTDDADADGEFIAELTRQMADYMLQEDDADADANHHNPPSKYSVFRRPTSQEATYNQNHQPRQSYADTVKKSVMGTQIQPQIQLYKVENQPRVGQSSGWGRRGKMTESTQHRGGRVGAGNEFVNGGSRGYPVVHGPSMPVGSGMKAVFLGGSGSLNPANGTGVFLPRSAADVPDQSRKKPGCSTVLVPTRVLQALEQHFNNIESLSPSKSLAIIPPFHRGRRDNREEQSQVELEPSDLQETKLPQEWIY